MQQSATITIACPPMINDLNETTAIQLNSTHDDATPLNNKMATSVHGTKKTIHDKQKISMADCARPGVWANVGKIHQHQLDPTRATNYVLAGFYPRDVIKWIHA